jgi:hypothetical protein
LGSSIDSNASEAPLAVDVASWLLVTGTPKFTVMVARSVGLPRVIGAGPPVQVIRMSPTSSVDPSDLIAGVVAAVTLQLIGTGVMTCAPAKAVNTARTASAVIHLRKFIKFSLKFEQN